MPTDIHSSHAEQREISRIVAKAGYLLLKNGAETRVVVDIVERLGTALGVERVDINLTASGFVVTTRKDRHCITTSRSCAGYGIDMQVVTQIQHICLLAERKLLDTQQVCARLKQIQTYQYNRWLIVCMIGLSCASFCHLRGGDLYISLLTFSASSLGMFVRQELTRLRFNPVLVFGATAFITTLISSLGVVYEIGNQHFLAMACSVLMLVPGFPIINSVADMIKGYVSMGIARGVTATLLTFSISIGIVGAMSLMEVWGWLA